MTDDEPLTYESAGVSVARGEEIIGPLRRRIERTWGSNVRADVAGFQAVIEVGDQYVVGGTDGVGTKLLVAMKANKHETVGEDLVAMCVNDVVRAGVTPLFFLDYFATGMLEPGVHEEVISGIATGCEKAGISLLGGETAEMPGMYAAGHYDLAGFAVGMVPKDKIIDGSTIQPGARLIGIESSGIHSNGLSLARRIFFDRLGYGVEDRVEELNGTVGDILLEPTIIYARPVLDVLASFPGQVQGMAHITGGGMPNKLPKSLPEGLGARVELGSWPVHPIFEYMQREGPVDPEEMRRTFNMGIGMVAVVNDSGAVSDIITQLQETHFLPAYDIGEVMEGQGVQYVGGK